MTLVDVLYAFLLTKGWILATAVGSQDAKIYKHRAPADKNTICLTSTVTPRFTKDGKQGFHEGTVEVEIRREKLLGSDLKSIEFTVEKLKSDIVGLMKSDRIIRIICDRETDVQNGPVDGVYYYSIWFLVTLDLTTYT